VLLFGQDVTKWRATSAPRRHGAHLSGHAPISRLTVLDNVLLAIKGLRASKFVMWRFLSSYKEVYDKAYHFARTAASSIAGSRGPQSVARDSASSRLCSVWQATRKFCCWMTRAGLSSGESTDMAKFLMKLDPSSRSS